MPCKYYVEFSHLVTTSGKRLNGPVGTESDPAITPTFEFIVYSFLVIYERPGYHIRAKNNHEFWRKWRKATTCAGTNGP